MGALSAISDPSLRDWLAKEIMTDGLLETDPAALNVAIKAILDYLVENERHFVSGSAPTDIANGMIWLDNTNQIFKGRVNSRWESMHTGVINTDVTAVAKAGATGVLITNNLPASTLDVNLKAVRITCWGTQSGGNAASQIQSRFGTTALATHILSANATDWFIQYHIVRTAAATQDWNSYMILNRDDSGSTSLADTGTAAKTLSGALALDLNVSTINGGDTVTQEGQIIEILA